MDRWSLDIGNSVGPLRFGSRINSYSNLDLNLETSTDENDGVWSEYSSQKHACDVMCLNDVIVSITCNSQIYFKDQNLIGKPVDDVLNILEAKEYSKEIYDVGDYYSIESMNIDIFATEGLTTSVSVFVDPDKPGEPD